jgi:hypothetical protein
MACSQVVLLPATDLIDPGWYPSLQLHADFVELVLRDVEYPGHATGADLLPRQ